MKWFLVRCSLISLQALAALSMPPAEPDPRAPLLLVISCILLFVFGPSLLISCAVTLLRKSGRVILRATWDGAIRVSFRDAFSADLFHLGALSLLALSTVRYGLDAPKAGVINIYFLMGMAGLSCLCGLGVVECLPEHILSCSSDEK
jgi:hypothetical protein